MEGNKQHSNNIVKSAYIFNWKLFSLK